MVLWGFEPQSLDHKTERRTTRPQNLMRDVICRMCCSLKVFGSIRTLPSEKHVTLVPYPRELCNADNVSFGHFQTSVQNCLSEWTYAGPGRRVM